MTIRMEGIFILEDVGSNSVVEFERNAYIAGMSSRIPRAVESISHVGPPPLLGPSSASTLIQSALRDGGGFRREVQPRRQHWFLNEKSGFPFRTPAFCSVSRGQRRLGEKEYRAPSVTPGVALRPRTQGLG